MEVIFHNDRIWDNFWIFPKITLLCYPQKKYIAISRSWVWWHSAKVGDKVYKSSCKITVFQFFARAEGKKNQLPTPTNHSSRIFCVIAFSTYSAHLDIKFSPYFKIVLKNWHFIEFLHLHKMIQKNYTSFSNYPFLSHFISAKPSIFYEFHQNWYLWVSSESVELFALV